MRTGWGEPFTLPVEPRGREAHTLRLEVYNRATKALLGASTLRVGGDLPPGEAQLVDGQVEKVVTTALDDDGPEPEPEIDEEAKARARW